MDSSCKLVDMYGNETDYLIRFSLRGLLASGCPQTKVLKANQVSTNQVLTVENPNERGKWVALTTGGRRGCFSP